MLMLRNNSIVYVAPPFEEVQNEVTRLSDDGKALETSFHSDVALLMHLDRAKVSQQQLQFIEDALKPFVESSSFRDEFENTFGAINDDELLSTCPSRYIQTASEQKAYLEKLAHDDLSARKAVAEEAKKKKEREELEKQNQEFSDAIKNAFGV